MKPEFEVRCSTLCLRVITGHVTKLIIKYDHCLFPLLLVHFWRFRLSKKNPHYQFNWVQLCFYITQIHNTTLNCLILKPYNARVNPQQSDDPFEQHLVTVRRKNSLLTGEKHPLAEPGSVRAQHYNLYYNYCRKKITKGINTRREIRMEEKCSGYHGKPTSRLNVLRYKEYFRISSQKGKFEI